MQIKVIPFIAISIGLHLLVATLFNFQQHTTSKTKDSKLNKNTPPVKLEVIYNPTLLKQTHDKNKQKSASSKKMSLQSPSLDQLRLKSWDASDLIQNTNKPTAPEDKDWGSGGADFQNIKLYSALTRLFENVNGALYYPDVLVTNKIEGVVNARLVFTSNGSCDFKKTQISSRDDHLKVFILDLLWRTCHSKYPAVILSDKKNQVIDLSFYFELSERPPNELKDTQNYIVGSTMHFYRGAHQSVMQWSFGPFMGIFPIPAVSLDFVWLKENWDKYLLNKKDPLVEFRDKLKNKNI